MNKATFCGKQRTLLCVLLTGATGTALAAEPYSGYPYASQYPSQVAQDPSYSQPNYVQPGYVQPGYAQPQAGYPNQAAYGYATDAYQGYAYPQSGYAMPLTTNPGQGSAYNPQSGYFTQPSYPDPSAGYTLPPAYAAQQPTGTSGFGPGAYVDPSLGQQAQQYPDPNAYADPGAAQFSMQGYPRNSFSDLPVMDPSLGSEWLDGTPLRNPIDNRGYWANPGFQPWSTGPFAKDEWNDVHPMSNMPWGNFPGWGSGPFGGFGPESWEGVTPWGNDVPFRWIDPTDPRDSLGDMWDDALNTPNRMGRMPPGWTAPYISVPNPIDVEEEFERNARNFPDEMRKAINTGESDWGGSAEPRYRDKKDEQQKRAEQKRAEQPQTPEKPWMRPVEPVKPYGEGFGNIPR